MSDRQTSHTQRVAPARRFAAGLGALALLAAATAGAQPQSDFPGIPVWAYPGLHGSTGPDSIQPQARTVTVRWRRDFDAEARTDFGGYRMYRVISSRDTSRAVLLRRFSRQLGDEIMWHFDPNDTVLQFVDPDSAGNFVKVCKRVDKFGRCLSIGDSVWRLVPPPGPHDGYAIYYAITYEGRNVIDNNYDDLYVPDVTAKVCRLVDAEGNCLTPGDSVDCTTVSRCPNLNNKARNMLATPVYPTGGPTANLERIGVVPNPFRRREPWDPPGANEIHFINLPQRAKIRIYTVAGDLVATLEHNDAVEDFARWNLRNSDGREVASGIYIYRVESGSFSFQDRFIVVR